MRFLHLMYGLCLCACGTSSAGDAGVDATASDASNDVSTDGGADVVITDNECIDAGAACQACCSTIHPDASGIFDTFMANCGCGDGGACQTTCASSFCAAQTATKACDTCISKQCYPSAKTACNADPSCKAWLACLVPCP